MTVNSISSTPNAYQPDVQSAWKQRTQDFKALQTALQSGDLAGAQQAFAALQKDKTGAAQSSTGASPSTDNSQGSKDFQALQTALSSGNLAAAQQAFTALKKDVQGAGKAGHHHHHHGGSVSGSTTPTDAASGSGVTAAAGGTLNVQA